MSPFFTTLLLFHAINLIKKCCVFINHSKTFLNNINNNNNNEKVCLHIVTPCQTE